MKHIKNWKVFASNIELQTALNILREGKTIGGHSPVAIQHANTGKFIEQDKVYDRDLSFKTDELDNKWMILIPDDDKEQKNEKLRKLVKDSNCSGLNYDKIDNMTIHEIFRHIVTHINEDQEYRWLLAFYKNEIYKTK